MKRMTARENQTARRAAGIRWWKPHGGDSNRRSGRDAGIHPASGSGKGSADESALIRLVGLLRPYAGKMAMALGLMIGLAAVNIAVPRLVGLMFDGVFKTGDWPLLWGILTGLLVLYILRNILYYYSKYAAVETGENVCFELRKRLFERLQRMNLQYYQGNKPGQLSSRVMNDSFLIQQFIESQVPKLLQAALLFLGIVATIYAMNWQLAVVSTIVLPLHLLTYNYFKRRIKNASRSAQEHIATATGNLVEKFLGIEVVKGFTGEQRENAAFQAAIDRSRQSQLRGQRYHLGQKIMADFLIGLGMIALLGFGAYQILDDHMQVGEFVSFLMYIRMLYPTVVDLMGGFAKLAKASASIERVFDLLEVSGEEERRRTALRPEIRGQVRFEHVSFRYPNGALVLDDVSFTVGEGQVCAITGPSGAGKSTMANLLPRFNDPSSGRILIDGVDTRDIDVTHLRERIGFAFQECFLFASTIVENLRYAKPTATRAEVIEVARRTGADEFISNLPNGYDTVVGESGVNLSRGEKQLLNLTRAMLKNPRILILDEATASMDEARESAVIPEILRFMKGKTVVMITHRAESLKYADIVLNVAGRKVSVSHPKLVEPRLDALEEPPEVDMALFDDSQDDGSDDDSDDRASRRRKQSSGTWGPLTGVGAVVALMIGVTGVIGAANTATAATSQPPHVAPVANAAAPKPASKKLFHNSGAGATGGLSARAESQKDAHTGGQAASGTRDETVSKPPAQPIPKPVAKPAATQPAATSTSQLQTVLHGTDPLPVPQNAGQFIPEPGLDGIQVAEMLDIVAVKAKTLGYRVSTSPLFDRLPIAIPGLRQVRYFERQSPGQVALLEMGYKSFLSQPPHVWLYGVTLTNQGVVANEDIAALQKSLATAQKAEAAKTKSVSIQDLASGRITLSYVSVNHCLGVLRALGYNVVQFKAGSSSVDGKMIMPADKVDTSKLPLIMTLPTGEPAGRVGQKKDVPLPTTVAGRRTDLLVFYPASKPVEFGELKHLIRDTIDVPARQIVIEAMVLEISNSALQQLGVKWTLETGWGNGVLAHVAPGLKFGMLPDFSTELGAANIPSVDATINNAFHHWQIQLQALIRTGKAQVLSRPSVLTLNNRQAYIHVGQKIPIATSVKGLSGSDELAFDFDYEDVGISLNVRPRVSADGQDVSMQINGQVSAEVPGQALVLRDSHGNVLASAPRISERDVQTYTRIANNTPFIIGGLISKDNQTTEDKVPILGDIPVLGNLFKSTKVDNLKREVIIVITPYVLPKDQIVGRNLPKDVDAFDSFGNKLFRNAYRIRSEDVFDLGFLTRNRHLRHLQSLADQVVAKRPAFAERYPFDKFVNGGFPGQRILVFRQMYDVVKREGIAKPLTDKRMIFFQSDTNTPSGFKVKFLAPLLSKMAAKAKQDAKANPKAYWDPSSDMGLYDKALAITFTLRNRSNQAYHIMQQPVPVISLVDCPDQNTWEKLLWKLNQPDDQGRQRYTILIHDKYDLMRLKRAIMVKQVVKLNGSAGQMTLKNFTVGRQLLLPTPEPEKITLLDSDVAKYFWLDEQYYAALRQRMDKAITALETALRNPKVSRYLDQPLRRSDNPPEILPQVQPK